jgi:Bifunctional DNA primase/polymerase, N-terminal
LGRYAHMHQIDHPVIPVTLYQDEAGKWKKRPLVSWDRASTDEAVREGWWRVWPDAHPGIPLRLTDLVVVDADTPEAVEEMRGLRMLGPHSRVETANGGLHMVFAQPLEPITRFRWSEGVEVLGTSSLLTCYDLEELRFPRVAPRAVLPEMFWRPRAECGWRVEDGFLVKGEAPTCEGPKREPRIKRRADRDAAVVGDLTAALWEMDATDWRGDYDGWFHLAGAAQAAGISKREFVRWSLSDPHYAADQRSIERIWDSAWARHAGALFKALSERGIKVGKERSLYPGHPLLPQQPELAIGEFASTL